VGRGTTSTPTEDKEQEQNQKEDASQPTPISGGDRGSIAGFECRQKPFFFLLSHL
jgi:hypothetical protein